MVVGLLSDFHTLNPCLNYQRQSMDKQYMLHSELLEICYELLRVQLLQE
jgi:hypothetical protein